MMEASSDSPLQDCISCTGSETPCFWTVSKMVDARHITPMTSCRRLWMHCTRRATILHQRKTVAMQMSLNTLKTILKMYHCPEIIHAATCVAKKALLRMFRIYKLPLHNLNHIHTERSLLDWTTVPSTQVPFLAVYILEKKSSPFLLLLQCTFSDSQHKKNPHTSKYKHC